MKGKIIGCVVSIIFLVGLGTILVVGVRNANKSDNPASSSPLSSSSKAVQAVCGPTDYKEACIQSLNSIANNQSATPKDYIQVAINATIDAIRESIEKSRNISKEAIDPFNKMALDDCREMLQFAIDELHEAFSNMSKDDKGHTINEREIELKNWLSATIAYQETCVDGIGKEDLKEKMAVNLVDASHLSSNVLAIVSEIIPILNSFGLETNVSIGRKLLHTPKNDNDEYPSWVSNSDRKLLRRINMNNPKPNVVVAQDGSGQFKTINAALKAYPKNLIGRYVIYVKAGIYNEQVLVTKDQVNIFMFGDGPRQTIVTGKLSVAGSGTTTYQSATFAVIGNGFVGKSMGFRNTAGPQGHQAVALRVQSDMSIFYNCRMDGYQDTLYTQAHRQFYRNCVVSGTVDFIFGDGSVVIQNTLIIVRKPMDGQQNTVTAQGKKDRRETTGIVIHNCRIVPEQLLFPLRFKINTFLGRPWKEFSTTVIMQSLLADFIQPAGWMPWAGTFALDTLYYAEFGNRGPGAVTSQRVRWKGYHVLTNKNDVVRFTVNPFIQGHMWIKNTGTPYLPGLKI
ncbi:hypothetical protein RND81_14G075100 [Saponaria officinalis]|uniref:Pectinesterase n=1 Tax=Saponaria officinalis TaxID=3572 RepID=A0AAW1GPR0_SAPOF